MDQQHGGQQQDFPDYIPDLSVCDTPYHDAISTFSLNPSYSTVFNHADLNRSVVQTHVAHASQVRQLPSQYQYTDCGGRLAPSTIQVNLTSLSPFVRSADDAPWSGPRVATDIQDFQPGTSLQLPHDILGPQVHPVARQFSSANVRLRSTRTRRSSFLSSNNDSGIGGSQISFEQFDFPQSRGPTTLRSDVALEISRPAPSVASSRSGAATAHRSARGSKDQEPIPNCCERPFRNQSEAKKHKNQHDKPHRCQEPGCARHEGFGTKNDLERHRKSIHKAYPAVGKALWYICRACPPPSTGPPKRWPRLDNFAQHVGKIHKGLDQDYLIRISTEVPQPDQLGSESGYGSVLNEQPEYQNDFQALTSTGDICMVDANLSGSLSSFGHHLNPLAGIGEAYVAIPYESNSHLPFDRDDTMTTALDSLTFHTLDADVQSSYDANLLLPVRESDLGSSAYQMASANYTDEQSSVLSTLQPTASRQGFDTGSWQESIMRNGEDDEMHRKLPNGSHQCTFCKKIVKRRCDIRKHLKRHTRPYGCTFPDCFKRFGSLSDWKRHEIGQHPLMQLWSCNLLALNGQPCTRAAAGEEDMLNHLRGSHGLDKNWPHTISSVKAMYLGVDGYEHVYCGFCKGSVGRPHDMPECQALNDAWTLRHKHIGDHFDKEHRHVRDWICVERQIAKQHLPGYDRPTTKVRSNVERLNADGDVDFVDDHAFMADLPASSFDDSQFDQEYATAYDDVDRVTIDDHAGSEVFYHFA